VFSDPVNFIDPNGKLAWNVVGTFIGGFSGAWRAHKRGDSIVLGFVSGSVTGFFEGGTKTLKFVKGYVNSLINQSSDSTIGSVSHRQALINAIIDASGLSTKLVKKLTDSKILQDLIKRNLKDAIQFVFSEIEKDLSSDCR